MVPHSVSRRKDQMYRRPFYFGTELCPEIYRQFVLNINIQTFLCFPGQSGRGVHKSNNHTWGVKHHGAWLTLSLLLHATSHINSKLLVTSNGGAVTGKSRGRYFLSYSSSSKLFHLLENVRPSNGWFGGCYGTGFYLTSHLTGSCLGRRPAPYDRNTNTGTAAARYITHPAPGNFLRLVTIVEQLQQSSSRKKTKS